MRKIISIILTWLIGIIFIGSSLTLMSCIKDETIKPKTINYENSSTLKEVDLEIKSTNVNIVKSDTASITIELEESNRTKYVVTFENGILRIIEKKKISLFFSLKSKKMTIAIPEGLYDFDIEMASGSLTLESLPNYNELSIELASGSLNLANATCQRECNIDAASGSVNVEKMIFNDSVELNMASGSINFKEVDLQQEVDVNSASGTTVFDDVIAHDIEIESASGAINLNLINLDINRIHTKTGSGSIKINLPAEIEGFEATIKTGSGSYSSNFAINNPNYYGNGKIKIKAESGSGSIRINK